MRAAHDETWRLVAERGYDEEIRDPATVGRLRAERDKALAQTTGPAERLRLLIEQPADHPGRQSGISAAIADPDFPIRDQRANTSLHLAQERAHAAVIEGLRRRVAGGLDLPFQAEELVGSLEVVDDGPVAARILDVTKDERGVNTIAILAGPHTVGALIDQSLACVQALKVARNDMELSNKYHRLRERIARTRATSLIAAIKERGDTEDVQVISPLATIISLHGGRDDRETPLSMEPADKQLIIGLFRKWVQAVISSPDARRYDLCEVGNAIGRIGYPELLPDLRRLLDEDLARLKKAREGYLKAQKRGDIEFTSDAAMRYGNQYREAFTRIGGEEAADIVAAYLEDRHFGFDAAVALKAMSDRRLNVPKPSFQRQWPRFEDVAAARARRAAPPMEAPADTFSRPIIAAIDRLAREEVDKEGQLLAIQMARIGLAMPHSNQDALIERVIALPQPLQSKRELLAAIVLDGQTIDAELVMQAIDEWLAEASKNDQIAWHKKQNTWEIEPWLELLPFTTRPDAVIPNLEKVKTFYGSGWRKRWERVLSAVASVLGAEGDALLATLARTHKDIAGDYEWMKAILGRDSPSAVLLYLDLYLEGIFGRGPHAINSWNVGRELVSYAEKFPELEGEFKKRYEAVGDGPGRQMLEHLFGEFGGDDDLIAMVRKYAAGGQGYNSRMDAVVRAVALRHEPMSEGATAYYVQPASVSKIRKDLFGLIRGMGPEATLAKQCLVAIDQLRDEYGIAANDNRHPDVASKLPWPEEVEQWFDEPQSGASTTGAFPGDAEIVPEDIAEFARMKDVQVQSADEWMNVMSKLPEEKVKAAIAKLLSEPPKKDWGGESNDHYGTVTVNGRRATTAFLFKGPSVFREMTLDMCGKRADQIYRLAKSGAEISVVQHSHLIGEAVRETLQRMVEDRGRPRKYCVIDGKATYRILKAYNLL